MTDLTPWWFDKRIKDALTELVLGGDRAEDAGEGVWSLRVDNTGTGFRTAPAPDA